MPTDPNRIVYKGKPSVFMFAIVLIPLGLVAVFTLRMAWVGATQIGDYGVAAGFAAFAALMIYIILRYGWSIFGPSLILTPDAVIVPGTFRTKRYPIAPDTQVIRWDRRFIHRELNKVGEASQGVSFETSKLLMEGPGDKVIVLASMPYGSGRIAQREQDLKRIAGIAVQHLTPDGMVAEPAPPPSRWPKPSQTG